MANQNGSGKFAVVSGAVDLESFTIVCNRAKFVKENVFTGTGKSGKPYHRAAFTAEGGRVECFVSDAELAALPASGRGRFVGSIDHNGRISLVRFESDAQPASIPGVS